MTAINLRKAQELDANPKAIQKISFTWKSRSRWKYNNIFHYLRSKRDHFRRFTRNRENIVNLFCFDIISI